jgi:hypothetical protein
MRRVLTPIGGVIAIALIVFAIMPDDDDSRGVSQTFDGLPSLADGYAYEAWIAVGGTPVSAGQFTIDDDGEPVAHGDTPANQDFAGATSVTITIVGPSETASAVARPVLGGVFVDGEARLTTGSLSGLRPDAEGVDGLYTLGEGGGAVLTFRLTRLPPGWVYEAWLVRGDEPTSLGRFGEGHLGDETLGQHRIASEGLDLRGGTLLLTAEPHPDDSPTPFPIHVLEGRVRASADADVQYQLLAATLDPPTGVATLK